MVFVFSNCDRVIIINKGTIVADDTLSNLQANKINSHTVLVQFQDPVSLELLEQIKAIDKITVNNEQQTSYKFQTSHPESVRKELLELSLKHNLNIVSLQSETQSLEEIFRELTG